MAVSDPDGAGIEHLLVKR